MVVLSIERAIDPHLWCFNFQVNNPEKESTGAGDGSDFDDDLFNDEGAMAQLDASINAGLGDEPNDKENKARGNGDSGVGKGGKARYAG